MMTESEFTPLVRSWLRDRDTDRPDPDLLLTDVFSQLAVTQQSRGRWYRPRQVRATVVARTSRSMLDAAKFGVAGAIVALSGGILLAGALTTQRSDEQIPAAVKDSPVPTPELLPGVDLIIEEVEPGMHLVLSDGVRDLEWAAAAAFPDQPDVVTTDGDVWLVFGDSALRVGDDEDYGVDTRAVLPYEISVTGSSSVELVPADHAYPPTWSPPSHGGYAIGPGQTVWERPGGRSGRVLRRHTPEGTEEFTADDGTPVSKGQHPGVSLRTVVAPDGAVWFSLFDRGPAATSDCGGLARYDGRVSTYFLQGGGFCVLGLDVDAQGRAWVLGWNNVLQEEASRDVRGSNGTLTQLYLITPEAVATSE